jgi:hypothetical protein
LSFSFSFFFSSPFHIFPPNDLLRPREDKGLSDIRPNFVHVQYV